MKISILCIKVKYIFMFIIGNIIDKLEYIIVLSNIRR